jgi:hypothetical protein
VINTLMICLVILIIPINPFLQILTAISINTMYTYNLSYFSLSLPLMDQNQTKHLLHSITLLTISIIVLLSLLWVSQFCNQTVNQGSHHRNLLSHQVLHLLLLNLSCHHMATTMHSSSLSQLF